jgi:glycosyltransferase involved in cell wall biosynthesis
VITVSEAQRQALLDAYPDVPPARVVVLENPAAHRVPLRPPELGDDLTITYTGNLGLSQGLDHVLHVADRVRGLPVRFLLHGRGAAETEVRALATRLGLDNVAFSGFVNDGEYMELLQRSDVLLLSLRPGVDRYSFPSKLWTYMTAGRPIWACVGRGGAVEETLTQSGSGIVTTWGNVEEAVDAVKDLFDVQRRSTMSAAAVRFQGSHLTPEDHANALADLISGAVQAMDANGRG